MYPAVIEQPGRISRIGAGFGDAQLFAKQQHKSEENRQNRRADADWIDIFMVYHRRIPLSHIIAVVGNQHHSGHARHGLQFVDKSAVIVF